MNVENEYYELLKLWCDNLLTYQINDINDKKLDGAILCPACMVVHGRCHELIYPLSYLADKTGDEKYLVAAKRLFTWGENLLCDDGSFFNDGQSSWNGITVFSALSLYDTLKYHGHLLTKEEYTSWEERLQQNAMWIYNKLTLEIQTNINYFAASSAIMALLGEYFNNKDYLKRADDMANYCFEHIAEDGLLYGEGKPRDGVTKRGCRPVDIGYNVEESLPLLYIYAQTKKDEKLIQKVEDTLLTHLDFMLPDGGWDNSMGTRNFKWTYWGSRTCDGAQVAYATKNTKNPLFPSLAYKNFQLYKKCTHNGLLYGGMDYEKEGHSPCVHHTFCHAKALAYVLDHGVAKVNEDLIDVEQTKNAKYYPTIDTYKISNYGLEATVTGYDFEYVIGGHTSGGTLSMLWHELVGPIIAAGMTDYSLYEAHNMQQSTNKSTHISMVPRVALENDLIEYSNCYDDESNIKCLETVEDIRLYVKTALKSIDKNPYMNDLELNITYDFSKYGVKIVIEPSRPVKDLKFIFPIISSKDDIVKKDLDVIEIIKSSGIITVESNRKCSSIKPIFNLCCGFSATELSFEIESKLELYINIWQRCKTACKFLKIQK